MSDATLTPVLCPICASDGRQVLMLHGFGIRHCGKCHHRFADYVPPATHVEAVYDDDYFFGGGGGYADYAVGKDALVTRGESYGRMINQIRGSAGSMLDVGAAAGFLLQGFHQAGWSGVGLEPNNQVAQIANANESMQVHSGTLETFESDEQFDLVSMIQVAGHFHDVNRALARAFELTRPGGYWLIETWDFRSLAARVMGKHWHEYTPPSVLQWFSRKSLRTLGEQIGMEFVKDKTVFKTLSVGRARALLKHKSNESLPCAIGCRLLWPFPKKWRLVYPADDLFCMVFQKPLSED